jgi:hypothetical protein
MGFRITAFGSLLAETGETPPGNDDRVTATIMELNPGLIEE